MKQKILTIIFAVLTILLLAATAWFAFVNLSLKKEVSALKERLSYEEVLIEEMKKEASEASQEAAVTDAGSEEDSTMVISAEDAIRNELDKEKEEEKKIAEEEKKAKKKKKKADLSNMETIAAQTEVKLGDIDQANLDKYFKAFPISDKLFDRIYGDDRSFKTYCTVPREALSYIKVLHYDYEGKIRVGEMIINAKLVDDILYIFKTLFENQYQIEKMILVEAYGADDDTSVNDNNTSCFNFRAATDATVLSNHATGCAVDINPLQNPYFRVHEDGSYDWDNLDADKYWDRSKDPAARHMINHEDLCYRLFAERGFTWGGDWPNPIDYQHFEKPVY